MKKLFSLFALLVAFTFSAQAEDFSVANSDGDTIYYNITDATALTVEVTYDDNYFPDWKTESVWYTDTINIPSSVTYEGTTYSVTSIGQQAFLYCAGLSSVIIPASVTSIEYVAFRGCSGLSSATIPANVTSIGIEAFLCCTDLSRVTFLGDVIDIGENAFGETAWLNNQSDGVVYISNLLYCYKGEMPANTAIVVKDGVTSIGSYAFEDCIGLSSITIPDGVTSIGDNVFYGCTGLSCITIPIGVTSIGDGAFSWCTGLSSITIPAGVTYIGYGAFWLCSGLTHIKVNAVTPPTVKSSTFDDVDRTIPVYVPMSSVAAYQTHEYWGEFSIQGVSSGPVTPTETVKPDEVNFIQNGNTISFSEEQQVSVYSINGVCVFSGITRDLQLTSRGTYIVVTASGSTKVII